MKCDAAIVMLYVTGIFGTQSYIYNHRLSVPEHCEFCAVEKANRAGGSVLGGIFWPAYWTAVAVHAIDRAISTAATAPSAPARNCQYLTHRGVLVWPETNGACVLPPDIDQ